MLFRSASSEQPADHENQANAEQHASESSQESQHSEEQSSQQEQYISVPAGQGLYRVAVNNGLTLDQLLQLNPGLTANSSISPGQQIRVK